MSAPSPTPRLRFSALGGQKVVIHVTSEGMSVNVNGETLHTLPLDQAAERLCTPPCFYGVVTSERLHDIYPTKTVAEDKAAELRTSGLTASIIEVPSILLTA